MDLDCKTKAYCAGWGDISHMQMHAEDEIKIVNQGNSVWNWRSNTSGGKVKVGQMKASWEQHHFV